MNQEQIKRFLNGSYSQDDQNEIYAWLVSRNMEHHANALLKQHWDSVNKYDTLTNVNLKAIYNEILSEIDDDKVRKLLNQKVDSIDGLHERKGKWKNILKYAAVVICAFGLSYFAFDTKNKDVLNSEEITIIEKSNSKGQKSQILLKDQSKIILNSDSRIVYNSDFGISNRDITLSGEAYFEVEKNVEIPFNVIVNNTTVTAIGTSFNISTFNDVGTTSISLATGKAKIITKGNQNIPNTEIYLELGQQYLVNQKNERAIVKSFDPQKVLSWKDNILYFDDTKMTELISTLERWYNVKIIVLNPEHIASVSGTGQFKNESLENVLRILSYSLEFDYKLNEDKVTISFK